jgi:hypothetical protein
MSQNSPGKTTMFLTHLHHSYCWPGEGICPMNPAAAPRTCQGEISPHQLPIWRFRKMVHNQQLAPHFSPTVPTILGAAAAAQASRPTPLSVDDVVVGHHHRRFSQSLVSQCYGFIRYRLSPAATTVTTDDSTSPMLLETVFVLSKPGPSTFGVGETFPRTTPGIDMIHSPPPAANTKNPNGSRGSRELSTNPNPSIPNRPAFPRTEVLPSRPKNCGAVHISA